VSRPDRTILKQSRQEEMVVCIWHYNGGDVEKCSDSNIFGGEINKAC